MTKIGTETAREPIEAEHRRGPTWANGRRFILVLLEDIPGVSCHAKVAAYMLRRDEQGPVFSERERSFLLAIAGMAKPRRRYLWMLHRLSLLALDLPEDLDS